MEEWEPEEGQWSLGFLPRPTREMASSQGVRKIPGLLSTLSVRTFTWSAIWKGLDFLRVQKV